jgi:hypothetical protein
MGYRVSWDPTDGSGGAATGNWQYTESLTPFDIPLSMSCWAKVEHHYRSGTNSVTSSLMSISNPSNAYASVVYFKEGTAVPSDRGIGLKYSNGTTTYYNRQLNFNNWNHICFVWAGATSRLLYLNGIQIASEGGLFSAVSLDSLEIGNITNGTTTNGLQIAEYSIFRRALSAREVFQLSKGETNGLRRTYAYSLTEPYVTTGTATVPFIFNQTKGGQVTSTNDSPLYTRPTSIFASFGRRRLFVVS